MFQEKFDVLPSLAGSAAERKDKKEGTETYERLKSLFENLRQELLAKYPADEHGIFTTEADDTEVIEWLAHSEAFTEIRSILKHDIPEGTRRLLNEDCFSGRIEGIYCGLRESRKSSGELVGAHHWHGHDGDTIRVVENKDEEYTRMVVLDAQGHGQLAGSLADLSMAYLEFIERGPVLSEVSRFIELDKYIASLPLKKSEVSVITADIRPKEGDETKKIISWERTGQGFIFWLEEGDDGPVLQMITSEKSSDLNSDSGMVRQIKAETLPNVGYGVLEMVGARYAAPQFIEVPRDTVVALSSDGFFDSLRQGKRLIEEIDVVYGEFLETMKRVPYDFNVFQRKFFEYIKDLHRMRESKDDTAVIWKTS